MKCENCGHDLYLNCQFYYRCGICNINYKMDYVEGRLKEVKNEQKTENEKAPKKR